jgi:hypothetical protein
MRSIDATPRPDRGRPDRNRPDRRCGRTATTLVVREPHGSGPLAERRRRFSDRVLAHVFGSSLDHQLAAGRPPESGQLLATRALALVCLGRRRALARNWEHLLVAARRPPAPGRARIPLCRDRILAAEPDIHEMVARLRAPLPVRARGVATAGVLLADAAGPLYNRHNHAALPALLRSAIAQLDPAAALAEPAVA